MENGTQPAIYPVVPWTFKKAKHSTWYAENEAFELHKWTGISSLSFLSLAFTMFGVCCSQSFSPKSAGCGTKPAVGATVGQSQRQGCTPFPDSWALGAILQSGSWSHLSHPQLVLQLCRFVDYPLSGNIDLIDMWFSTYAGALPAQFFYVPVFISSPPFSVSNPFHCCCAVWVWLSTHTLTSTWI